MKLGTENSKKVNSFFKIPRIIRFLHQMDLNFSYFRNDGYVFLVRGLVKGSKPHKPHLEIFLPSFPPYASLCVAFYLKGYIDVTSSKRNNSSSRNFLFISYIKPHKAVKTSSISRWLKNVLRLSGIDTSQFSDQKICVLNIGCELWSFHIRYYERCRLVQSWNIQEILSEAHPGLLCSQNLVFCILRWKSAIT